MLRSLGSQRVGLQLVTGQQPPPARCAPECCNWPFGNISTGTAAPFSPGCPQPPAFCPSGGWAWLPAVRPAEGGRAPMGGTRLPLTQTSWEQWTSEESPGAGNGAVLRLGDCRGGGDTHPAWRKGRVLGAGQRALGRGR